MSTLTDFEVPQGFIEDRLFIFLPRKQAVRNPRMGNSMGRAPKGRIKPVFRLFRLLTSKYLFRGSLN